MMVPGGDFEGNHSDPDEDMEWATPFGVGQYLGMVDCNEPSTNPNASMKLHWLVPHANGAPTQDANAAWKLMCSHPSCHATKHTRQGQIYQTCQSRCTPWVDEVLRGSVVLAKAKLGQNGKLSKATRLELISKGYTTIKA